MDTNNAAAGGELEPAPVVFAPNLDSDDTLSVEQAFEAYQKRDTAAESAEAPATADTESADEAGAGPEEVTSETEATDQAEQPPIEAPKSWSKEARERWSSFTREAQEEFARIEQGREREFLRGQQEAANARKAAEAEQAQWKQEREQYVAKQTAYTQALENALQSEFGDIRSLDDVRKMQAEDPFRFQQWQLRQYELGQAKAEQAANEQRSRDEQRNAWAKFTKDESDAFENDVPEFKAKKDEYTRKAAEMLTELGFSNDELTKLASGEEKISLFDRRMQRLLFDRIRLSEIKAAPPKAMPKPVPAVQKPGVAPTRGAQAAQSIQALRDKLTSSGSVEDAYALYEAKKRRSASR